MDYKEKYNAAFERAKKLQETCDNTTVVGWCEYIFPELKESEDEKIRKELIEFIKIPHSQFVGNRRHNNWIAWLEKQGKKQDKSVLRAWKDMRLEVYQQASGNIHEPNYYSDDNTKMFSLNDIDKIIEKISE